MINTDEKLKVSSPKRFMNHESFTADNREAHILVVSGTYYDMGKYIGKEFSQFFHENIQALFASLRRKVALFLNKKHSIDEEINTALNRFSSKIPLECKMEMLGIYDGCREAGFPLEDQQILEKMIIMIELGEQECTLFAAHPPMTTGNTYQLRDLDYFRNINMPYIPTAIVRIPQDNLGNYVDSAYAAFDFIANIAGGVITGINEHGVVISQCRGLFLKQFSYEGTPIKYLIQQVLSKSITALDAKDIIKRLNPATAHFAIVSDPLKKKESLQLIFMGPQFLEATTYDECPNLSLVQYKDDNLRFYKPIDGIVYWTEMANRKVDDISADFNMKDMYDLLKINENKLDKMSISKIAKNVGNDDTVISAFFDTTTKEAWVAYASRAKPAHYNEYIHFDLKKYFDYKYQAKK